MPNYAPQLPRDKGGEELQEFPAAITAKVRHASDNQSSSSVVTLGHDTTALEIAAHTAPLIIKWISTTDTAASVVGEEGTPDFDHIVSPGTLRRFVVPIESNPETGSVQGVNRELGLYQRVAWKSQGNGSVLAAEF